MRFHDIREKYDIRFKKQLGQNLLLDDNINRIMVDAAALAPEDDVVEVGAGLGMLTAHMHPRARRVLAIEIDKTFMPVLEERFGEVDNVVLFRGDVLNHELDKLLDEFLPGGTRFKLVSNLPYYITTPLLFHFWESGVHFSRFVVMVQEEVALRLTARTGSADYGVLTINASLRADVDLVHKVPRTCFKPAPKVDSAIVRMRTLEAPRFPEAPDSLITRIARAAFGQRRKTLRNTLAKSGAMGLPPDAALEAMEEAGVNPQERPQNVSLEEFAALARAVQARRPPKGAGDAGLPPADHQ